MFSEDYVTEAEALSDIYEGCENEEDFEPYTDSEKRQFLAAKGRFTPRDKGKFVIVQSTRVNRKLISRLFLVDRNKTKRFWWSHDAQYAMLFIDRAAAEKTASRYKYNNAHVVEIK